MHFLLSPYLCVGSNDDPGVIGPFQRTDDALGVVERDSGWIGPQGTSATNGVEAELDRRDFDGAAVENANLVVRQASADLRESVQSRAAIS